MIPYSEMTIFQLEQERDNINAELWARGLLTQRAEAATQWQAIGYIGPGGTALWEPGREPEKGALLYRPISGPLSSGMNNGE